MFIDMNPDPPDADSPRSLESLLATVRGALRGLRFGSVEIVVHDGRVVQVERRERVRLDAGRRPPESRGRQHHADRSHRTDGGTAPETDE